MRHQRIQALRLLPKVSKRHRVCKPVAAFGAGSIAGRDPHWTRLSLRYPVCIARLAFAVQHAGAAEMLENWWRGLPALAGCTHGRAAWVMDDSGNAAGEPARCRLSCSSRSAPAHRRVRRGRERGRQLRRPQQMDRNCYGLFFFFGVAGVQLPPAHFWPFWLP